MRGDVSFLKQSFFSTYIWHRFGVFCSGLMCHKNGMDGWMDGSLFSLFLVSIY